MSFEDEIRERLFWRHDDGTTEHVPADDIEIFHEDGDTHLRVRDTFGSAVSYVLDEDDPRRELGWRNFFAFVDDGPYLPKEDRPQNAKSDYDYSLYLCELEDERRDKEARARLREAETRNPMMAWLRRQVWMVGNVFGAGLLSEYGEPTRPADVLIFCTECREKIGEAWHTPEGWLLRKQHIPTKESIPHRLMNALHWREQGWEQMAQTEIANADDLEQRTEKQPFWMAESLSDHPSGDGVIIGCHKHLNVLVDRKSLRDAVKNARRAGRPSLSIPCSKK